MSTTTGNVKISELAELSTINDGAKLKIPVSNNSGSTSTPNWESYGVTAAALSNFFEGSLGLSGPEGLFSKVSSLIRKNTELEKQLGNYDLVPRLQVSEAEHNKYISTSGKKITLSLYSISNKLSLKQGNLYLFFLDNFNNFPDNIALMAKVDEHTYRTPSGTTGTDIVYEPLPTYYRSLENGGYGSPSSGFLVFFATENMDVVISCSTSSFVNGLFEVKYGAFIETASKLLTVNGELMKVLVEAIVKNKKDIDSINENMKSLGDVHANSIDLDDFPSVQGEPMVVVADRRPSAAGTNHGDDVPNRIGQIWVDTTSKQAYIAVALGSTGDASWKQITV